ncbi:Pyruvate dehydrogenase E1 component OS=Castellaniella defragrans OX=75697 GN=HNR28_002375 PE=4 SV=1 [Castellaniella defragrans]
MDTLTAHTDMSQILGPVDPDPQETQEWRDALHSLLAVAGHDRARFILDELVRVAKQERVAWHPDASSPYLNTISLQDQPPFPGELSIEERLGSLMRWNALAMVVRANKAYGGIGGHIASYTSAADLFEVGFNHFFHAREGLAPGQHRGDLVFFQPHSATGVYARAFLEGHLTQTDLEHFRQEISAPRTGACGLSSYPHPWCMPDFWQFPTGSMGIGPISSIYQARFMRYLSNRGLLDCAGRKVWGVFGDGEMDEPESTSALTLAARENLDNLVWVVNCNLQRLDGPVRGNGRIIDELEHLFAGSGWNVIKLLWGSDWDGLFARDTSGSLERALRGMVDGAMQTLAAKDGRYNRDNFFNGRLDLSSLTQNMTDQEIDMLRRGGHDLVKIHAAYAAAAAHRGTPTVILALTKKGYGMGEAGQGKMTTHSKKKLDDASLIEFRDRFNLPLTDEQARNLEFLKPADNSPEMQYLHARRKALGGYLPRRETTSDRLPIPDLTTWGEFALSADGKEMSTTMAFMRMLAALLKDPAIGPRIVPIVADEARTFGMASLFRQVGIYSSAGQNYAPEDTGSLLYYREARDGQILEEGITEAGALASWTAAATSYSVHGLTMLPFFIYYSMFGFQRVGDLIWAAGDQRARGFLLGATSGRTTLAGEGLQHQDGSSHLVATTIPNCKAYDPAFAGELAIIVDAGMREMVMEQRDVFYYVTVMNENYAQPSLPQGAAEGVRRGAYVFRRTKPTKEDAATPTVTLMGSGAILNEAVAAAAQLAAAGIASTVISVTSWSELARDGRALEHAGAAAAAAEQAVPWITALLESTAGPVIAASDYVHSVPEAIRAYIPHGRHFVTLGTDGFGRSDTRAALRRHFGIDADTIAQRARAALTQS